MSSLLRNIFNEDAGHIDWYIVVVTHFTDLIENHTNKTNVTNIIRKEKKQAVSVRDTITVGVKDQS